MKKINSTFVIMIMLVLFITAIDSISEVEVVEMHKKLRYCSHMKHKCRRTKGPALENIDNCIKNSDAAVECNRLDSLKLLECQYMICWWRSGKTNINGHTSVSEKTPGKIKVCYCD